MRLRRLAAATALSMAMTGAAGAAVVLHYTATLSSATPSTGGAGQAGVASAFPSISGTISYDPSQPVQSSTGVQAIYDTGAITVDQFDVGAGQFDGGLVTRITISGGSNEFDILDIPPTVTPGTFDSTYLQLVDSGGTALAGSGLALPSTLGLFATADTLRFENFTEDGSGYTTANSVTDFTIDSLSSGGAPEASTWMMLIAGAGLAGARLRLARHRAAGSA